METVLKTVGLSKKYGSRYVVSTLFEKIHLCFCQIHIFYIHIYAARSLETRVVYDRKSAVLSQVNVQFDAKSVSRRMAECCHRVFRHFRFIMKSPVSISVLQ